MKTTTRSTSLGLKGIVAAAVAVVATFFAAGTAGAVAAPGPGTYSGNQCQSARWYVDNAGAEACLWVNGFVANRSVTLAPGAFDYARDGLSARTVVTVQQYSPTAGWYTRSWSLVNSAGYGTTRVGSPVTIARIAGTTVLRITLSACTYDSPTGINRSCGSSRVSSVYWATGNP